MPTPGKMSKDDAAKVLQIKPNASRAEMDAAYRALVKIVHPDRGGTNEDFHTVDEAYRTLLGENTDPENDFQHAMQFVSAALLEVFKEIGPQQSIKNKNLIALMTEKLQEQVGKGRSLLREKERFKAEFQEAKKRILRKNKRKRKRAKGEPEPTESTNLLIGTLDYHLAQVQKEIEPVKKQLHRLEMAVEILNDVDFQVDSLSNPMTAPRQGGMFAAMLGGFQTVIERPSYGEPKQ